MYIFLDINENIMRKVLFRQYFSMVLRQLPRKFLLILNSFQRWVFSATKNPAYECVECLTSVEITKLFRIIEQKLIKWQKVKLRNFLIDYQPYRDSNQNMINTVCNCKWNEIDEDNYQWKLDLPRPILVFIMNTTTKMIWNIGRKTNKSF